METLAAIQFIGKAGSLKVSITERRASHEPVIEISETFAQRF